jgi:hypothetical protein
MSRAEVNELVEARMKELRLRRGWLRRLAWWIRLWFFCGPRAEIAHDVQVVQSFAKRSLERWEAAMERKKVAIEEEGKAIAASRNAEAEANRTAREAASSGTEPDKAAAVAAKGKADEAAIAAKAATTNREAAFAASAAQSTAEQAGRTPASATERKAEEGGPCNGGGPSSDLVEVLALLECAKTEHDFAQAWTYVNLADAILTRVVDDGELDASVSRLATADARLPEEYRALLQKQRIPEDVAILLREIREWMSSHQPISTESDAGGVLQNRIEEALKRTPGSDKRTDHHADQLVRTTLWNGVNRKISLKLALWASIRRRLLFAILAFFGAVALLINSGFKNSSWRDLVSLLAIGLLGLFGGMLSAFLQAREEEVNVPSYQVVLSRTSLRMLLGGAGAIVVYSVGLLVLSDQLQTLIRDNLLAFMTVGIVAGFSERLFIDTLEQAAANLHTSGSPTKDEDKAKTSDSSNGSSVTEASSSGQPKVEASPRV